MFPDRVLLSASDDVLIVEIGFDFRLSPHNPFLNISLGQSRLSCTRGLTPASPLFEQVRCSLIEFYFLRLMMCSLLRLVLISDLVLTIHF